MFVLSMLAMAGAASAATCRVATTGDANNNGATWANAMTLQAALADANICDEVWVQAGTYKPTDDGDRSSSFNILPGVEVYGGFDGTETLRSARDPGANPTTLSGDIGTSGDSSDNSYHVVYMDGTTAAGTITASTVLDGFTISGGNADGSSPDYRGGGLYCDGSGSGHDCSPNLSNLTFSGNSADWYGGAMFNNGNGGSSSPTLSNVVFSDNRAGDRGGAIYNYGHNGGNSSPSLSNVTFSGNSADTRGGAIYNYGAAGSSNPTLSNVTFSGNSASLGGAIYNYAPANGNSSPTLSNVTFSGNSASLGGAIYNYASSNGNSSPTLSNVIAWGNTAADGPQIFNVDDATPIIDHSVIQGSGGSGSWEGSLGTDGGGNIDADPLLGALANNGGLTLTMLPGASSSAIDAGNNTTCTNAPVNGLDQRGVTRPQGAHCDIGAVEVVEKQTATHTVTGSVDNGQGTIAPTTQDVDDGNTATLTVTPDAGWQIDDVAGCGGTLNGNTFTTGTLTADCTVTASFAINSHSVGGTVAGLTGSGLVLQINGGDDLTIAGDGTFTFATPLDYGTNYSVTAFSQPTGPAQTCAVSNASGSVPDADISNVAVNCTTNTHTVTTAVDSGNGSITPASQSVDDGGTASLTVNPDTGWHIDDVTGCDGTLSGDTFTTGPVTADCTVTASFAQAIPVPTLDWRLLLLLAGLLGGFALLHQRRA